MAERWLVTISTTASFERDGGNVGGILHQSGHVRAHGEHAVMQAGNQIHHLLRISRGHHALRKADLFHRDLQVGIEGAEVGADIVGILRHDGLELGLVGRGVTMTAPRPRAESRCGRCRP